MNLDYLETLVSSVPQTKSGIPKIIMQTWKDERIPAKWQASVDSCRERLPDWYHVLMTDQLNRQFVERYYPDFLATYDSFPYQIQRVDAVRYMWLYRYGGGYVDLDIVFTKSVEDLLVGSCQVYLVPSGNIGTYYTNALMFSQPRCSFWLECLDEMRKPPSPFWLGRHFLVMNTTGPMMLTRVARRSRQVFGVLPASLLIPCSLCDLPCQYSADVYAYAIPGSSWVTWDTHFYTFFFCHWRQVLVVAVVVLLLIVIWLLWYFLAK